MRRELLNRQRVFREPPGLVADGRDMGTVVFPDALLKIYLDASVEERVQRRYQQLKEKGINVNLRDVSREMAKRDAQDKERLCAPLKVADDAVLVDTTGQGVPQVLARVLKLARSRLASVSVV